jgi:hypothetical protein
MSGLSRKTNEVHPDPWADKLLETYRGLNLDKNDTLRSALLASPLIVIGLFYILIS